MIFKNLILEVALSSINNRKQNIINSRNRLFNFIGLEKTNDNYTTSYFSFLAQKEISIESDLLIYDCLYDFSLEHHQFNTDIEMSLLIGSINHFNVFTEFNLFQYPVFSNDNFIEPSKFISKNKLEIILHEMLNQLIKKDSQLQIVIYFNIFKFFFQIKDNQTAFHSNYFKKYIKYSDSYLILELMFQRFDEFNQLISKSEFETLNQYINNLQNIININNHQKYFI